MSRLSREDQVPESEATSSNESNKNVVQDRCEVGERAQTNQKEQKEVAEQQATTSEVPQVDL